MLLTWTDLKGLFLWKIDKIENFIYETWTTKKSLFEKGLFMKVVLHSMLPDFISLMTWVVRICGIGFAPLETPKMYNFRVINDLATLNIWDDFFGDFSFRVFSFCTNRSTKYLNLKLKKKSEITYTPFDATHK